MTELPTPKTEIVPFDWSEWEDSFNALQKGQPTRGFEHEAWNAIVDKLWELFEAVDWQWDETYGTRTAAKMGYYAKKLYASMMNNLRLNIDRIPFPWAWAANPNFRGYIGRVNFRGAYSQGSPMLADRVYPEYILELARRLNLLIAIIQGTAALCEVETETKENTLSTATVHAKLPLGATVGGTAATCGDVQTDMRLPAPMAADDVISKTYCGGDVEKTLSANGESAHSHPTANEVSADGKRAAEGLPFPYLVSELYTVEAERSLLPLRAEVNSHLSELPHSAAAKTAGALQAGTAENVARSVGSAEADKTAAVDTSSERICPATESSEADTAQAEAMSAVAWPAVGIRVAGAVVRRTSDGSAEHSAPVCYVCEFAGGWENPIWVDNGLWIRQVHDDPTINDNGELVIT